MACAGLVRSSHADVEHSRGDCDCNGNQLDALGIVAVVAQKTLTRMAFVTMSVPVSANSIRAVCAMARCDLRMRMCRHF